MKERDPQQVDKLSPQRQELLRLMLATSGPPGSRAPRIQKRQDPSYGTLSYGERRLWFLNQLEPDSPAYNLHWAVRIQGPLSVDVLREVYAAMRERHAILRTSYQSVDGAGVPVVQDQTAVEVPVTDLSGLPASEQAEQLQRQLSAEARRPFDLAEGPLMRPSVVRLDTEEHVVQVAVHHIVADGRSLRIWARETRELYEAFVQGQPSPLAELPIQYADYAAWQTGEDRAAALESDLAYWKDHLAGIQPLLKLPTDRPRPPIQSYNGERVPVRISGALLSELRALGQRENATLFTVLLSALQVLLYRNTGQTDLVIGTPVAGRGRPEVEGLIGCFVNMLPLRTDVSGDPTFRELLGRGRSTLLGALAHQELPFERLVEELQPERTLSFSPLFQVMLNLQEFRDEEAAEFTWIPTHNGTSLFDLSLSFSETPAGLDGFLEYSTDLFDESTMVRMLGHFESLLAGIVESPNQRISKLTILTTPERRQLLVDWNATGRPYPPTCIHYLFEDQAARTPDAIAVIHENRQMSYGELNSRANQLAHYLRDSGVGLEDRVGLCMQRSPELLAALLGILKSGGAYVPLDPAYPAQRLALIVEDAQPRAIVTDSLLAAQLPSSDAPTICLDFDNDDFRRQPTDDPSRDVSPANLAYVMYTSGSTGKPKGVALEHRGTTNLLHWAKEFYPPDDLDGVLAPTSICFDLSVFEFFAPLACGGKIILANDAKELPELSAQGNGPLINTVPSAMDAFVHLSEIPDPIRVVNLCGEPLSAGLADRIYERGSVARLYDLYGPAETTTYSTVALRRPGEPPTVGRPIANTLIYILDANLEPVPIGVPGEVFIGGAGLARGYLNRPDLTAEKFLPNPFVDDPEARIYRTGDLAKYRSDGNLELLGRQDHQVQVRGYRIELGDIETAIRRFRSVDDSAVLLWEPAAGDQRLVAYVASAQEPLPSSDDLRSFLSEQLPGYMVPSQFVFLDALPRTANGKLDRRALAHPSEEPASPRGNFAGPRDALEATLARIWEETLGIRSISRTDNFFDLGGHSLLAVRLFAEIEKSLSRSLPLMALFQAPTIEQLARIIRDDGWVSTWTSLVPMQPEGSKPPFYCVHANGGHIFFYNDLARRLGPDQPMYGLQSVGLDGASTALTSVEEMAARYIKEIRTVQPDGPYSLGGFCFGAYIALEMACQLQAEGEEVALLASINTDGAWRLSHSFRQGVSFHLRNLAGLDFRGKLTYVADRASYRTERLRTAFRKLVWKYQEARGRTLPPLARIPYIFELNARASTDYQPRAYRGKLAFFQGSDEPWSNPEPFWDGLVTGGIEIHAVPGKELSVLSEPNAEVLAEKLRECLDQARAEL